MNNKLIIFAISITFIMVCCTSHQHDTTAEQIPEQVFPKGDIVKIPPDTEHWHGASPEYSFTHIAISPNTDKGSVVWLAPVLDEEYNNINVTN
jgi:quercetin dioxygenase-like cupin family protein